MKTRNPVKSTPTDAPTLYGKDPLTRTQQIVDLMEIMSRKKETAVRFEINAPQDSKVYIAGTFNNWDPTSHPLEYRPDKGTFRAYILLKEGTYEYKFVVNGIWQADEMCPERVTDENGNVNSVIRIQCPTPTCPSPPATP